MTSKGILAGAFGLLAAQVIAQGYDVAAYVWPAYQPEPRWAELGIFKAAKPMSADSVRLYELSEKPDETTGDALRFMTFNI